MPRLRWLLAATAVALASCGGGGDPATASTETAGGSTTPTATTPTPSPSPAPAPTPATPTKLTLTRLSVAPNPTGLEVGFWEAHGNQASTLQTIGKRPVARVGFDNWAAIEQSPGVYTFPPFTDYQRTHAFGERIMAAVNVSFSNAINPGHGTIPAFYAGDITDPATRVAARRFLYAYVQALLRKVGAVTLTIDYEIVGNWKLHGTDAGRDARAAAWGAWYVEAAGVARQAAADLGQSSRLALQPIVNTDPLAPGNPVGEGATARNQWLVDVVAASDALALDTYYSDPGAAVDDPTHTIDTIRFWIDHFSAGKPVVVCENGFSTATSQDATITRNRRQGKYTGTEADQARYFQKLFPALQAANAPGGPFHNQLRAFGLWSIIDNNAATDPGSVYFGLLRLDGSEKPSAPVVRSALAAMDADAFHQPTKAVGTGTDVTATNATGTALTFTDGDRFDVLRVQDPALASGPRCHLSGSASAAASLLVSLDGTWTQAAIKAGAFDVALPPASCHAGAYNVADVQATSTRLPFTVTMKAVRLRMD